MRAIAERAVEPVARALGYEPAATPVAAPPLLVLEMRAGRAVVPWTVAPWGAPLEPLWRSALATARAHASRWAILCNGIHLRILDGASTQARRWVEIDLDLSADDVEVFASLWLIGRAEMQAQGLAALVGQSDAFAAGVCRSLRHGVLRASEEILAAVVAGRRSIDSHAALAQALTVVYRMLFLLFAESRGLVPMWHPVYRHGYSIDALRAAAERGRVNGLWDGLRAVSRLAHAGCRTGQLTVTPFNGRLFDAGRAPFVERRNLDDRAAGRAVLALTTRPSIARGGREPIAYGDLGVEQLGAVYETLLDYEPTWDGGAGHGALRLAPGSGARKATGSFYTPQPIARYLVRQTLMPLVAGRRPHDILALRVLDPSMGSGACLVTACAFLAAAYEDALVADGDCDAADLTEADRARFRRLIAERCLFGVDLNPMAVQLARLSLWLATLAADRPLSFLDHHLRTGDSLVGAWLASLTRAPAPRRRSRRPAPGPQLFEGDDAFEAAARTVVPARFSLAGPGDTVDQVRAKERLLAGLDRQDSALSRWRRVADLWCARWFTAGAAAPPATYGALADAILRGRSELPTHIVEPYLASAADIAAARRFFHWELEFPEVFFDRDGRRLAHAGFDAIVGNPPWDMMRGDTGHDVPRAAAKADAARAVRFCRDSGVYDGTSHGQANRYQLFVDRTMALLRPGGRFGLVLPGGVLSDHGSGPLRRRLFSQCDVDGVVAFDNRRAVFPIHRSMRFALVTATKGSPTQRLGIRGGESDPAVLEAEDSGRADWFPVHLSCSLLQRLSGADLAVPDVRQPIDLTLVERAARRFAPLGSRDGWSAQFGRELNATDDRHLLRPAGHGLPVVEGKWLHPFVVELARVEHAIGAADARRRLGARVHRPRLAYRDVAAATNRQTLIAALLPSGSASTHTVFCLKTQLPLAAQHFLCGLFNSVVVNYLVRQRVTTHVTTAIVERLPVPTRPEAGAAFPVIAGLARRLSRSKTDGGRESDAAVRTEMDTRLNAMVARLYDLTTEEYAHVLETFPLVPRQARERCLEAYRGRS